MNINDMKNDTNQLLNEGLYDPHIFKAVFTAGAPGAGKTSIANRLFSHTGLKELNVDTFWSLYHKMNRDEDYDKFHTLTNTQFSNFVDGRLGLLIDGTSRKLDLLISSKNKIETIGYDTAMIFVNASLKTCISRAIERNDRIGRHVPIEYIEETWIKTQRNLGRLQSEFGANFYIIDNDRNPNLSYVEKSIDAWLNKKPTKQPAREWIAMQSELRSSTLKTTEI